MPFIREGAERHLVMTLKDAGKLPPDVWLAIRSIKQIPTTGMLEMTFQDRLPAIVKIGELAPNANRFWRPGARIADFAIGHVEP